MCLPVPGYSALFLHYTCSSLHSDSSSHVCAAEKRCSKKSAACVSLSLHKASLRKQIAWDKPPAANSIRDASLYNLLIKYPALNYNWFTLFPFFHLNYGGFEIKWVFTALYQWKRHTCSFPHVEVWSGLRSESICVVYNYHNCWQMSLILWPGPQKALEGSHCLVYHFEVPFCFYSLCSENKTFKMKSFMSCYLTVAAWLTGFHLSLVVSSHVFTVCHLSLTLWLMSAPAALNLVALSIYCVICMFEPIPAPGLCGCVHWLEGKRGLSKSLYKRWRGWTSATDFQICFHHRPCTDLTPPQ